MAAWTPSDLTNSSFVGTLSAADKSQALTSVNRELPSAQQRLAENAAAMEAADTASNNGPQRSAIRALTRIAEDTSLPQADRDAALAQANTLTELRESLSLTAYNALVAFQRSTEYVEKLVSGQSNLITAGADQITPTPTTVPDTYTPAPDLTQPQNTDTVVNNPSAKTVTPAGIAYDDEGNLMPGYELDEDNNPVPSPNTFVNQTAIDSNSDARAAAIASNGTAYDDDGNINPGWTLDENNDPVFVGGTFVEQATIDSANDSRAAVADHGTPYDDDGNLMPGWSLSEDNDPVWVGGDFVEPAVQASAAASRASATGATRSLAPVTVTAKKSPFTADDWRIRLSLADTANYLYKIAGKADILYPLVATNGVVFPYTPVINTAYRANYDPSELTHSNYKMFFYKNSSVDDISITADFTAQDTAEANYMLAVIHFFKSATKMFYGQDASPRAGTPPPLLYLTGYGHHQFENHPLLLTNFTYNLPNDVDYIRAGSNATWGGSDIAKMSTRLASAGLQPGGVAKPAAFSGLASKDVVTYLPTKIQITLSLVPVVTRNDISKNFSLKDYAAGKLSGKTNGGIW
jgi:hypothetical protein